MRPTLYAQPWWQQPGTDLYGLVRTAAPTAEPIPLEGDGGAKAHLKVDIPDNDGLIRGYLATARAYAEKVTGRQLMPASWRMTLDRFPLWEIRPPKPPLLGVTSVTYVDAQTGNVTTLDPALYLVNTTREPGLIEPAFGTVWPTARWQSGAVVIDYTAGYASADLVPETVKQAILLHLGWLYYQREATKADWGALDALLMTEFAEGY